MADALSGLPPNPPHLKRNSPMLKSLLAVFADEDGASLVEYALIVALVGVVAIAGLTVLGTKANATLTSAASQLSS